MLYRSRYRRMGRLSEGGGGFILQYRYFLSSFSRKTIISCASGTLRAFLSGRVSHFMKWGGPSVVVDTACSSSIVAIYQACRALQNNDCNAALAGGVNIICSPDVRWSCCYDNGLMDLLWM